ncbi:uncharacterized protein LOC110257749 isoform X2 [Sus scrofa]|uniref:uncharacterized protein LOC110257749 isoform X2 n=1 Tax=Sus scrofa TaxID=9823 RepID=UPI000A2B617D|nr:uncharacterized protein LOC110257749 isoform X2 [Sus scrofa]
MGEAREEARSLRRLAVPAQAPVERRDLRWRAGQVSRQAWSNYEEFDNLCLRRPLADPTTRTPLPPRRKDRSVPELGPTSRASSGSLPSTSGLCSLLPAHSSPHAPGSRGCQTRPPAEQPRAPGTLRPSPPSHGACRLFHFRVWLQRRGPPQR